MAQRQRETEAKAGEDRHRPMNELASGFEASVRSIVDGVIADARSMHANAEGLATIAAAAVANEVKALATQTAKATSDITAQIGEMQAATGGAAQNIKAIGETIQGINEITDTIASAVKQQRAATAGIAHSVQEASANSRQVTRNIEAVAKTLIDTDTASKSVLGSAAAVFRQADVLSHEVEQFVSRVRAQR